MKTFSTKLVLCSHLPQVTLYKLADQLGAEFRFVDYGTIPFVRFIITFASGDKICSEHHLRMSPSSIMDIKDYAEMIKDKLIRQALDFINDQIRDQIDPPEPFVDTGLKFHGEPIFFKTSGSRTQDKNLSKQLRATWQNPDPWYLHKFLSL